MDAQAEIRNMGGLGIGCDVSYDYVVCWSSNRLYFLHGLHRALSALDFS